MQEKDFVCLWVDRSGCVGLEPSSAEDFINQGCDNIKHSTKWQNVTPSVKLIYLSPADSAMCFRFCGDGDEHLMLVLLAAMLNNSPPQCHEWWKAYVAGREDALQTIELQYRGVNPGKRGADNPSNCPGHLGKLWGHRSGPEYATLSLRKPKPGVFFCPIFLLTMSPLKCHCLRGRFKWGVLYTYIITVSPSNVSLSFWDYL